MNAPSDLGVKQSNWLTFRDVLGPGLIAGASGDDPSGIAAYSRAGAEFRQSAGWDHEGGGIVAQCVVSWAPVE